MVKESLQQKHPYSRPKWASSVGFAASGLAIALWALPLGVLFMR